MNRISHGALCEGKLHTALLSRCHPEAMPLRNRQRSAIGPIPVPPGNAGSLSIPAIPYTLP